MKIPRYLDSLDQFARTVWGNPYALLKQLSPQNIEYINLGKYLNAFRILSTGILQHEKILVRDEYRIALQELQTDRYRAGSYVTGQPGIGKTYFLIYALVYFLGQKQPVAMHLGGRQFYILFNDTISLYPLTDEDPLYQCGFVWALSDSNSKVQEPPTVFMGDSRRVRIIQATSPTASRWKEWAKQMGAGCYIMDVWSEKEIVNLAMLLEWDIERMTTLAKKWGNIPRTLLQYFAEEDDYIENRYRLHADAAIERCSSILARAEELDLTIDLPSLFYFIGPTRTDTGSIRRYSPAVSVPTLTLCKLLADAIRKKSNRDKLHFFNILSQHAQTRQAAGCIYKFCIHGFFSSGKAMKCNWVQYASVDGTVQLPTTLQASQPVIASTTHAPKTATPPYFWPAPANFPGIDGALVFREEIFVFQVTISAYHRSLIDGLRELQELLPPDLKQVPWRAVCVGADKGPVKQVAARSNLYFPTNRTRVPVAWSSFDDITFKEHYDEAGSATESMSGGLTNK